MKIAPWCATRKNMAEKDKIRNVKIKSRLSASRRKELQEELKNRVKMLEEKIKAEYPKRSHCSNCNSVLNPNDKFCRICGVSTSDAHYVPSMNSCAEIYGPPPVRRVHTCRDCGYQWETYEMQDDEKYCPLCGGEAPAQEE